MNFVVEDKHKCSTGSSDNVGKRSFEECSWPFVLIDLSNAIHGASVKDIGSSRLHHKSSSHGIEGIGDDSSQDGYGLSESPNSEEVSILVVAEKQDFTSIEHTEISSSVSDNSNYGNTKSSVKTIESVTLEYFFKTINKSSEFSLLSTSFTNISSESGSCEIKRIDEHKGCSSSSTTGSHVSHEEFEGFLLGVVWAENLLVSIFECKVHGLSGEVSNDVSHVSSPEGSESLFGVHSSEAISNALISLVYCDVLLGVLYLQ